MGNKNFLIIKFIVKYGEISRMLSARERYVETQCLSVDFLLHIEFIQNWEGGGDLELENH